MGTITRKAMKLTLFVLLSFVMIIALMPDGVQASNTWGDGNTDEERASDVIVNYEGTDHKKPTKLNWIQYKKGGYQNQKFTSIDDDLKLDPDKGLTGDHKLEVVKHQLKSWAPIASKIFKSGATTGGSSGNSPYGATSNTLLHDWAYYFEYTEKDGREHGRINLPDWLAKLDGETKDNYSKWPAAWKWQTSGIKHADSLADVRADMVKMISSEYGISADMVYKQRKNGENDNGVLSQINDNKIRKDGVYYTIVCHHTDEALMGDTAYNCYAIILYDLGANSLGGDGLYYPLQEEHYTETPNSDSKTIPMENKGEETSSGTIEYTSGYTESYSYSHQYTNTFNPGFGGELGFSIGSSKLLPVVLTGGFKLNGHFDYTYQDTGVDTDGKTEDHTETASISSELSPHTGKNYKNYQDTESNTADYKDPTYFNYKLALCSISGRKESASSKIVTPSDFCTVFAPTVSSDSGYEAITNLYIRRHTENVGESYGKTEGYVGNNLKMEQLEWTKSCLNGESVKIDGKSETISDVLDERESQIPMAAKGLTMNISDASFMLSSGQSMPLYPLTTVKLAGSALNPDNKIINVTAGEEPYSLSGLKVEGYDGGTEDDGGAVNPIKYHGFDPDAGYWTVPEEDKEGEPNPEGVIKIETDPSTKRQTIKVVCTPSADKPEKAYICWHMYDNKEYTTLGGKVVKDEDLKDRPYVEVVCHSPFEGYSLKFQNKTASGYAQENIPLSTLLPVDVYKPDGTIGSNNVEYVLKDLVSEDEAKIVDGTFLYVGKDVPKEGKKYTVYAKYGDKSSEDDTDGTAEVTVYPAKQLTIPSTSEKRIVSPAMEAHDLGTRFDLSVHCTDYKDQYGNPWEGDVPQWTFMIKEGGDNAEIQNITIGGEKRPYLVAKKIGTYKVAMIPKSGQSDTGELSDAVAEFTYNVTMNPLQAQTPSANTGLVYNGNEQTAVEGGTGYTVKDGSAVDAGDYTATATLKKGFVWADGYIRKQREIKYTIAPKTVEKPQAETGLVYNGKPQVGVKPGEGYSLSDNARATDAGTYEVTAQPAKDYVWSDGTSERIPITYTIDKCKIAPPETHTSFVYNGERQTAIAGGEGYAVTGGEATDAGLYYATAALSDKVNSQWTTGGSGDITVKYSISKMTIPAPATSVSLVYNGKTQSAVKDSPYYTALNAHAKKAGDYTATVRLTDSRNCQWSIGGSNDLTVDYSIERISVKLPKAKTNLAYTGKFITAVKDSKYYTVTGGKAKKAGDYIAKVQLNDTENYQWNTGGRLPHQIVYTIGKGKNTLTAKGKTKKVKYSKLRNKNQLLSRSSVITVKKAKGKLSYVKKSGSKKISVSKTGKVTVKKGLKKGTYKIKAKVRAAGNSNYKAKTKTVTFKIKVI